jgi:hypothetical protein
MASASFILVSEGYHTVVYYAIDNEGNQESPHSLNVKIDKSAPAIAITGVANCGTYTLGATPTAGYSITDNISGVANQNATLTGGNANSVGPFTYTVNAIDNAGNNSSQSTSYAVVYLFNGFISPLSGTSVKAGNNISVKFQLKDALGNYISTANATLMLQEYAGSLPIGNPIPAASTSGGNAGSIFRYDSVDKQYVYNLGTKGLSPDTWQLVVMLDDGTKKTAFINLK